MSGKAVAFELGLEELLGFGQIKSIRGMPGKYINMERNVSKRMR